MENFIPLKLIFDTGAENTLIFDKQWLDLFKDNYVREIKILGSDLNEEIPAFVTKPMNFHITNFGNYKQPLIVLKENLIHLDEVVGQNIHGILTASLFKDFLIQINYKTQHIILHENKTPIKNINEFAAIPIRITKNKPYINATVSFADQHTDSLELLLDTGAALTLLLYANAISNFIIPKNVIPGRLGSGLGGILEGYLGRIHKISIDKFEFHNLISNFQEMNSTQLEMESKNKQGILGNSILERFHVILDYKKEILYLKPLKNYHKEFQYDKSGLIVLANGFSYDKFFISFILPGSPSAESGLMVGDQILSINRIPASFISLSKLNRFLQKEEGKIIQFKLKRDKKVLRRNIELRNLI
ncbi:MAG: aspartyl protease family protein [Bacteroidota bacterium]|nr:aspartyl protease family protein [Bacteroidota bacterium]